MCYNILCHTNGYGALFVSSADILFVNKRISYWVKHPVLVDFRPAVRVTTSAASTGCFAMSKKCSKCGSLGPFNKNRSTKDGLSCWCKKCDNEASRKYRQENKKAFAESIARWKRKNKKRNKEINDRWRLKNRHKVNESTRKRRAKNPVKYSRILAKYRQSEKVKDKKRHYQAKRRAIKKNANGTYSNDEWTRLCNKYNNRCLCCGKKKKLTIDHVVPLSLGGDNTINNIQPLCLSCNSRKGANIIDYRKNGSVERWIQKELFHRS